MLVQKYPDQHIVILFNFRNRSFHMRIFAGADKAIPFIIPSFMVIFLSDQSFPGSPLG